MRLRWQTLSLRSRRLLKPKRSLNLFSSSPSIHRLRVFVFDIFRESIFGVLTVPVYAEGERAEVRGHLKTDGQTDAFNARFLKPLYSLVQTPLFAPFPGLNRMNVRSFVRDENTSRGFQCIQKVRFSCQRSPMVNSSLSRAEALSLALSLCVCFCACVCIYNAPFAFCRPSYSSSQKAQSREKECDGRCE